MKQVLPKSDNGFVEMCRLVISQSQADLAAGQPYLRQSTVDAVEAFLPEFLAAIKKRNECVQARMYAVNQALTSQTNLKNIIHGIWHETNRRIAHKGYPVVVRHYYGLPQSGIYPKLKTDNIFSVAEAMIQGDADAVVAGFEPTVGPSVEELQTAYENAWDNSIEKAQAKSKVSLSQNALATLRVQAKTLCMLVRDELTFALRDLPPAKVRSVMLLYGIRHVSTVEMPEEPTEEEPVSI